MKIWAGLRYRARPGLFGPARFVRSIKRVASHATSESGVFEARYFPTGFCSGVPPVASDNGGERR